VDILLTVRSQSLRQHGGQISFPGGRADQTDHGLDQTALRETHEEIGVAPDQVELLSELPEMPTFSGYRVKPFIGLIQETPVLKANPSEVDEVFFYPISHLLGEDAISDRQVFYRGEPRDYQLIMYQNYRIWGATAAILLQFKQLLSHNVGNE
jgi:8-oxo-dGTP pyrophosphatase MutT (NUDIX family)